MNKKNQGFTLVELLAVMAVLSIIMIIIFTGLGSSKDRADEKMRKVERDSITDAAATFYTNNKDIHEFSEEAYTNVCKVQVKDLKSSKILEIDKYLNSDIDDETYVKVTDDSGVITSEIVPASNVSSLSSIGACRGMGIPDLINSLAPDVDPDSTDVITTDAPEGALCTNTLAYDGTADNNLRYVGSNPCNYVLFNDERPGTETIYRIVNKATGEDAWGEMFENLASCNAVYTPNFEYDRDNYECRAISEIMGRWRIIGIMNNVDDGTGKKETRIKLVRNEPLGNYSWDVSENDGFETNDWTHATLMQELNGDYLNTSLSANTMWYNGLASTGGKEAFDYTKRLKASAQAQIGDVKWHLGGMTTEMNNLIPSTMYTKERGTEVYGNPTGTCNDGACPRATSWTGKVALIYPSDYGFATAGGATTSRNSCVNNLPLYWNNSLDSWTNSRYNDCKLNNWIPVAPLHRTLTPLSNNKYGLNTIYLAGSISDLGAAYPRPVFPSVYLKSSVKITGGSGTVSDPFIIG